MEISRDALWADLEQVKEGLSSREYIEQSSCFAFKNGQVMTFNDEIACRKPTVLEVQGAVQAAPLLSLLQKISDENLQVIDKEGEVEFRGKAKRFGVVKENEIFLPIDRVETPSDKDWKKLPREFIEGVTQVVQCAGKESPQFILSCVHITPDYVEATDNLQFMRYQCELGVEEEFLVRAECIAPISNLGMTAIAITKDWVHFRNEEGLIFSIRLYREKYPPFDSVIGFKGDWISFPPGLKEVCERAEVFARDRTEDITLRVRIKKGVMQVVGEGTSGWYKEMKKVEYGGNPIEFYIAPHLLEYIAENHTSVQVVASRMKVEGDNWVYITVLGTEREKQSEDDE